MSELEKLPGNVRMAVEEEIRHKKRFSELGFRPGKHGELVAENCTVTLYRVSDGYDVGIALPNRSVVELKAHKDVSTLKGPESWYPSPTPNEEG
jgi:hypothetical protein